MKTLTKNQHLKRKSWFSIIENRLFCLGVAFTTRINITVQTIKKNDSGIKPLWMEPRTMMATEPKTAVIAFEPGSPRKPES